MARSRGGECLGFRREGCVHVLSAMKDEDTVERERVAKEERLRREIEERALAVQREEERRHQEEQERLEQEEKERIEREKKERMAARGGVRGVRGTRASTRGTRVVTRTGMRIFVSSAIHGTNNRVCSSSWDSCGKSSWEH